MQNGRAAGTNQHHDRISKDYMAFVQSRGLPATLMTEHLLIGFMTEIQDAGKPYGYCTQVKGGLSAMMAFNKIPDSVWSLACQRVAEGIIRIAATNRTRGIKGRKIIKNS